MKQNQFIIGKPIPQPDRNAEKDLFKVLFFSLLFAIPLLIYIAMRVNFTYLEMKLSELVRKKEEVKREKEILLIMREKLLSLSNVEKNAVEKLGMVKEDPSEFNIRFPKEVVDKKLGDKE